MIHVCSASWAKLLSSHDKLAMSCHIIGAPCMGPAGKHLTHVRPDQGNVDGAFFGTTFPHLLLMTYPSIRPQRPPEQYAPRVFGFKLHSSALACAEGQSSGAHTNSVGVSACCHLLPDMAGNTIWRKHQTRSLFEWRLGCSTQPHSVIQSVQPKALPCHVPELLH